MGTVIRNKNEGISSFDTEDFDLAATLLWKGYELICMHPKNRGRRMIYHFVITSSIEKAAADYYESKKGSATDKFMAAMKNTLTVLETEERNVRKSK